MTAVSVGVLTADLTRLGDELECLRGKAAWAHVDVMDGAFCPQLTVGLRGVAINPGTPVCAVEPVLGLADLVLVLAGSPSPTRRRSRAGAATSS